jgi:hypothetical protein
LRSLRERVIYVATFQERPMTLYRVAILSAFLLALTPGVCAAKGCLKGAAVGGVVGHVAGKHGVAGAAVGCAVGHHEAKVKDRQQAQKAASPVGAAAAPPATAPPANVN